jgi:hypothetical protein
LDGDWGAYPERERVAMELTYKMTLVPHQIQDADLDALRPFYTDEQILEIVQTVAGYNSTNRWTDSLGIQPSVRPSGPSGWSVIGGTACRGARMCGESCLWPRFDPWRGGPHPQNCRSTRVNLNWQECGLKSQVLVRLRLATSSSCQTSLKKVQ